MICLLFVVLAAAAFSGSFDVILSAHNATLFYIRDGSGNPGVAFDSYFRNENVIFQDGRMKMFVDKAGCPDLCAGKNYGGGEYVSQDSLTFGYFGMVAKLPKNGPGIMIGSLFTYEHPAGNEIDIEFLGKDTLIYQVNYWDRGQYNQSHIDDVTLGFDSSEAYHEYGFVWQSDCITWYVDGVQVHQFCSSDIPQTPAKILMNIWAGNMADSGTKLWLGDLVYTEPVYFDVQRIRYIEGATTAPPPHTYSPPGPPGPGPGPSPSGSSCVTVGWLVALLLVCHVLSVVV